MHREDKVQDKVNVAEDSVSDGMNIIVPMGGIGSRFQRNGYRHPKPLINIVGRPMLVTL